MTNGSGGTQWPSHINALYQEDTTQLRFMKRQQWAITNYLLVLLGGAFGIVRAIGPIPPWAMCTAIALVAAAAVVSVTMLLIIQAHMRQPRTRLALMYGYWEANERNAFGLNTTPTGGQRDLPFLIPLILVSVFGTVIIGYAIAVSGPA